MVRWLKMVVIMFLFIYHFLFKKYKEINLTVETIEDCHSEGYLKSDLKE